MSTIQEIIEAAHRAPITRDKLHSWVKFFFGFDLHRTCRCVRPPDITDLEALEEGLPHNSQLDYVESCFFDQHAASLFTGARGCGKSKCIAVASILHAMFKPGIYVLCTSYTTGMVDEVKDKVKQFMEHYVDITGEKCWDDLKKEASAVMQFHNGSKVEFRTGGGKTNVASRHPDIIFIDECDKFPGNSITTLELSVVDRGFGSQVNLISTAYSLSDDSIVGQKIASYTSTEFDRPLNLKPNKIFRICLLDILEQCDDRYQCHNPTTGKNCALWSFCKGRAKDIAGGYYKITTALTHMASDASRRSFDAEMLLQVPVVDDAYFKAFGMRNIADPINTIDSARMTFLGWDFGGIRCDHVCVVCQKDINTGDYYVIDEFGGKGLLEEIIKAVIIKYPGIQAKSMSYVDNAASTRAQIQGAKSYRDILREHGFVCRSTGIKGQRAEGFEMIEKLVDPADGKNRLHVNKHCKNVIRQLYAARRDSHGKPEDKGKDDYLDAFRYVVWHSWRKRGDSDLRKRFVF